MLEENPHPKWHQIIKSKILGLSLRWDDNFVRNLVIVFGTVFVWVGIRGIAEKFIAKGSLLGYLSSISIGVIMLFLIDGDISQLGGVRSKNKTKQDESKDDD